jgi:nitrate/nitrite transport system permease protein
VITPTADTAPSLSSLWLQQILLQDLLPPLVVLVLGYRRCSAGRRRCRCRLPGGGQRYLELIIDLFYDNGGNDVGLGRQLLLQRGGGYLQRFAALPWRADLATDWATRGLDPLFQVLRAAQQIGLVAAVASRLSGTGHPSAIFVILSRSADHHQHLGGHPHTPWISATSPRYCS